MNQDESTNYSFMYCEMFHSCIRPLLLPVSDREFCVRVRCETIEKKMQKKKKKKEEKKKKKRSLSR